MDFALVGFIIIGLLIDVIFIRTEYAGEMEKATVLKGLASFVFVLLGAYCHNSHVSKYGKFILLGLLLGMVGDILLNLLRQINACNDTSSCKLVDICDYFSVDLLGICSY